MAFRREVLDGIASSYSNFSEHYKDIRSFFEIIGVRFAIEEYGVSLRSVGAGRLFTNASGFLLSDDSSYPFYLWLPSWLGRFYIDPKRVPEGTAIDDCPTSKAQLVGFIWTWLGFNDAYVDDAAEPECWFGVADPRPETPEDRVADVADKIWKYFRIERTCETESEGWLQGPFQKNTIGCDLNGRWYMRRVPLAGLTSFYQIEKQIIRPLGEKFHRLSTGADGNGHGGRTG
jgi:hypothetical protein